MAGCGLVGQCRIHAKPRQPAAQALEYFLFVACAWPVSPHSDKRGNMSLADRKREAVRKEIERRGLSCIQQGKAWHVYGLDVDIVTADLAYIEPAGLAPYRPRKPSREEWQS